MLDKTVYDHSLYQTVSNFLNSLKTHLSKTVSAAYIGILSFGKPMTKSADFSLGLMSFTQRGQNTKA